MSKQYDAVVSTIKNISKDAGVSNSLLDAAISALLGDAAPLATLLKQSGEALLSIRDNYFLYKFRLFVNGAFTSSDDMVSLSDKLFSNDDKNENALRIIKIIDECESERVVEFISNLTRAHLLGLVDRSSYFRMCHAVNNTLYEDLLYLQKIALLTDEIKGNDNVYGLVRSGLMISSGLDINNDVEEQRYYISSLGRNVDKYALSFKNEERYIKHKQESEQSNLPSINIGKGNGITYEPIKKL